MWIMFRSLALALWGITLTCPSLPGQAPASSARAVTLREVRYQQLVERVNSLHGQVVLVNFWATYCLPCKREFPHLVRTWNRFRTKGLVVLTVSLDDPDSPESQQRIRQFLVSQQADTENYVLREKPEVWQVKLKIDGPPCLFLFDQRGRLIKKYHEHVDFEDIDKRIETLLQVSGD
jgi:thiol-disulfide isomerase/thioredoxin